MRDDEPSKSTPARLELPKTGLAVVGGELIRRTESGGINLRIPLDDLEAIEFTRPFSPSCLIPIALGLGLAAIGFFVSEYNVATIVLYVLALCLIAFGLFGTRSDTIILTARNQAAIRLSCDDAADVGAGFVLSVKASIGGR